MVLDLIEGDVDVDTELELEVGDVIIDSVI